MFSLKKFKFWKKKEFVFLLILFLIGFFLRSFRLKELLIFAYDQGRDAVVVKQMIEGKNFIRLIGPTTGVQGFFLGPFFYYLILPFYWLGNGNPLYPAVFLAFLGALVIPAGYFLGKKVLGKKHAFIPAVLLAFNLGTIEYSRWLANSPPLILFSIVFIFCLIKSFKAGKRWAFLAGISLAFCLQSQFANTIFYLPLFFIYPLFLKRNKESFLKFVSLIAGFLLIMAPLFIFDFRHDHLLFNALKNSLSDKSSQTTLQAVFHNRLPFYNNFFKDKFLPRTFLLNKLVILLIFAAILKIVYKTLSRKIENKGIILILIWFLLPFVGLFFYTGNYGDIWDYYLMGQIVPSLFLISYLIKDLQVLKALKINKQLFLAVFLTIFSSLNYHQWTQIVDLKNYSYSISHQLEAINFTLDRAKNENFSLFIFVPNTNTESYDYLYSWQIKLRDLVPPNTISRENKKVFLVYEPDFSLPERLEEWYQEYEGIGEIVEKKEFGIITVEHRLNEAN